MAALLNTISSIRLSSTDSDRFRSQSVLTPASVSFTSKLTKRVSPNIIRFHYSKCNSDNIFCCFQGGDSRLSLRRLIQMKVVCFCGFIYTCLNFQATMNLHVESKNTFFGMVLYLTPVNAWQLILRHRIRLLQLAMGPASTSYWASKEPRKKLSVINFQLFIIFRRSANYWCEDHI